MTEQEQLQKLLYASSDGMVTAAQVTAAGLHRSVLQKLSTDGAVYRVGRGLYLRSDV